jgi:succinoglycan biosynthesis protein ExoA
MINDVDTLVTLVVPARDEEASIGACLDSLVAQTHRNLQIIVVDGASTDRTAEVVRSRAERDPRIELLDNPSALIPIAMNLALAHARGTWLVRVDAHATVPVDYVAIAVGHLATGRWGGVGGRKDGVGRTPTGRAIARAMASPFGVGNSAYHYATEARTVDHVPFGAYPVELARELGGWDERLAVNQDFEFDYRLRQAGYELLLDPELTILWECRQTVRALLRQYHRYGRGKTRVARVHPGSLRARHLAAPALVAYLGATLMLAFTRHRRWAAPAAAPYAVALGAASLRSGRGLTAAERSRLPLALAAMHIGWGVGFWRGAPSALTWHPSTAGAEPEGTGIPLGATD